MQNRIMQSTPVQVIVETPRGCGNKFKFDEETGRFKLSKIMPEGTVFPFDFGFFPGTKGDDGDPLDVLVLCDEPTFAGCHIDCRIVGRFRAEQSANGGKTRTDHLIAVAEDSILFANVRDLDQMEPMMLSQIEAFFANYA